MKKIRRQKRTDDQSDSDGFQHRLEEGQRAIERSAALLAELKSKATAHPDMRQEWERRLEDIHKDYLESNQQTRQHLNDLHKRRLAMMDAALDAKKQADKYPQARILAKERNPVRQGAAKAAESAIKEKRPFMTCEQVVARLHLSRTAVYDHPKLHKIKVGKKAVRFTTASVIALENSPPE